MGLWEQSLQNEPCLSQSPENVRSIAVLPYKVVPGLPVNQRGLCSERVPAPIWSLKLKGTTVDGRRRRRGDEV